MTRIAFKPNWNRDDKSAPFKRNDRILDFVPVGVIIFQGSGIAGNLADKAKELGMPILEHRSSSIAIADGPTVTELPLLANTMACPGPALRDNLAVSHIGFLELVQRT
jgi:hypothetical protein